MADVIGSAEIELRARSEKLMADTRKAERDLKKSVDRIEKDYARGGQKAADAFGRSQKQMVRDARQAEAQIKKSASGISAAIIAASGAFSVGAGAVATVALSDAYIRLSNSLRVAGLEGRSLTEVQEALFATAMQNGVQVETLAQLYGRAAQAAGELGASQADLIQFVQGVSAAVRIQGGSAAEAAGAITQLTQALAGGIVRAEEFASVNDGARPVLEAVAAGSDRFGGSVNALRAAVYEGTVTSQEFFAAFLAGSKDLEQRAGKSVLTVEQGMTNLQTAFIKYVGESAAVQGATGALANGLKALAENLDIIIPSLAAITVGLGTAYVGGVVAATGATTIFTNVLGGLRAALTLISSHPIIATLSIIAAGLAFVVVSAQDATEAVKRFDKSLDDGAAALAEIDRVLAEASGQTKGFGEEAEVAAGKVDQLCDAVDALTDANWRYADSALNAARAGALAAIAQNNETISELSNPSLGTRAMETASALAAARRGAPVNPGGGRQEQIDALQKQNADLMGGLIRISLLSDTPLRYDPQGRSGGNGGNQTATGARAGARDTSTARELLELERDIIAARASGDRMAIEAAEERLLLAQTIQKYERAGYEDAQAAALQEIAWLNEIEQREMRRLAIVEAMADLKDAALRQAEAEADAAKAAEEARRESERQAAEVEARMRESFRYAFRDGIRAAMDGDLKGFFESLADRFTDRLLENLADNLFDILNNALQGQAGGLAGVFSSIGSFFGGRRAFGGPVSAGMSYRVGEAGPETFVAPMDGVIVPNGGMKTAAGGAGKQPLTIRMEIDEGGLFVPRVTGITGPIAVQTSEVAFSSARKTVPADLGRRQRYSYTGGR